MQLERDEINGVVSIEIEEQEIEELWLRLSSTGEQGFIITRWLHAGLTMFAVK